MSNQLLEDQIDFANLQIQINKYNLLNMAVCRQRKWTV